jgi:tetratricopeptide (TPR) repeat protein
MSNSERQPQRHSSLRLDSNLGPARPLSPADVERIVKQSVERGLELSKKPRPRVLSLRSLSLAALAIVTSAAAATVVNHVRENASVNAHNTRAQQQKPKKQSPSPSRSTPKPRSETTSATSPNLSDIVVPAHKAAVQSAKSANASSPANGSRPVDQLSAANELRRKAQWQAAEESYRNVVACYPLAQEAYVAQLAAAELRLDHLGDPVGALRLYLLIPRNNPLGVEALFGSSRAYRALGDQASEMAILRSLVDAYPASLQADGARDRLRQLFRDSTVP